MERLVPFGKYFLLERINVGGMAEVFKAKTVGVEGFEKIVAIKRILPAVAEDEDFIKMFVDEAKITSQLSHANLAQTFDLGRIDDTYYIAMEYVPGKDLRSVFERLKRRGERVPVHVAAYIMARVCDGLDYAHRKRDSQGKPLGIVHRDVSPQNVITSFEGEVKLVDFGIAKAANKITKTQAGILKGKFGYMSPEQVRGLPLDGKSDIFAAGVVLYELVTGERLFVGSSDFSVLEKVQAAKITPPSQIQRDVPAQLEKIILRALARETEDRYQFAADLGADLSKFLLDHRGKQVQREDVAAFMKATFPPDAPKEAAQASQRPLVEVRAQPARPAEPPPRSAPPPPEAIRKAAPPVDDTQPSAQRPASMPPPAAAEPQVFDEDTRPMSMDDLAAAERKYAELARRGAAAPPPVETTIPAAAPPLPPASKPPPEAKPRASRPPPPLPSSLLADGPALRETAPGPAAQGRAGSRDASLEVTDPGIELENIVRPPELSDTTMPSARMPKAPPAAAAPPPPHAPPVPDAALRRSLESLDPSLPPPRTDKPLRPPVSLSRPPPARGNGASLRELPPAARSEGRLPTPIGRVQKAAPPPPVAEEPPEVTPTPSRPQRFERPPFGGRIAPIKPTLVAEDASGPRDETGPTLTLRALQIRRLLYAVICVALAVTAWALFSAARSSRKPSQSGVPVGSVTVTSEPEDSVVLLDGAQVKEPLDHDWTEPKLSAKVEHKLIVRHEGFAEQALSVTLEAGEHKAIEVKLVPLPGQLTVRSSPPGAQVFLDGTRRGVTPVYLADVDQSAAHAVVLEKHCFNTWQLAIPAHAGKREVAATLQPQPGACVGHQAREEQVNPEVPDDPAALASLGYLSLASRPSANVFIDGVDIGRQTPLTGWPLKIGKHKIRVRVGKKSRDVTVQIFSGQTHSEIIDLRKR